MDDVQSHRSRSAQKQPNERWAWEERKVDFEKDHFELHYGSARDSDRGSWRLIARVGPPVAWVFAVEFVLDRALQGATSILDEVEKEIDYYLVSKGEPNPWAYSKYHCGTAANLYSSIHWSFHPVGEKAVSTIVKDPSVSSEAQNTKAFPYPFTTFLSPVLRTLADGRDHLVEEIRVRVASECQLTAEELSLWHDSIHQSVFVNKVAHAFSRLVSHRAIVASPAGVQGYRITSHGLDVLKAKPDEIRVNDL